MATLNKAQISSLIIVPSITGCISSIASTTLIVSIFRSNQKLSTVYRRLVFALSVFDILQSIPQIFSSLPMPTGSIWGAIGNDITCDLQGFFATIGFCGAVLYSLSLTIYFLLVVKFNMSEAKIKKNVEPFLHVVPIAYGVTFATFTYVTNNYNSIGTLCWIAPEPLNCEDDPEVECLNVGNSRIMKWFGVGIPLFGCFIGNCTTLAVIWWTYRSQTKKNQAYGNLFVQPQSANPQPEQQQQIDEEAQTVKSCCVFCPMNKCLFTVSSCPRFPQRNIPKTSVLAKRLSRPSRASIRNMEEISNRAAAYVIACILTYMFPIINRLIERQGSNVAPFVITLLSRMFFPLQGLFNVLVYTYPHVISHRRNHADCNWFQAFWKVIKTGGDNDESGVLTSRKKRRSVRQMQRVLAQSEFRRKSTTVGCDITSIRSIDNQRGATNTLESSKSNLDPSCLQDLDVHLDI